MAEPGTRSYSVEAYNISHASENKIHDDAVAQKLGFSGGLVPGVEVYGYMTHLAMLPDTGFAFTAVPPKVAGMGTFPVRAHARLDAPAA